MFEKMPEEATKPITGNFGEFVRHLFRDEVVVEGDRLSSIIRRNSEMRMSRTAPKLRPLPSV